MLPIRPSAPATTDGVSGLQDRHPRVWAEPDHVRILAMAIATPSPSRESPGLWWRGWLCPGPLQLCRMPSPVWGGAGWGGRGVGPRRALTPSRLLFPAFWLCRGPWGPGSVCDGRDGVGPESILSYCRFLPELQITVSHPPAPAGPAAGTLPGLCRIPDPGTPACRWLRWLDAPSGSPTPRALRSLPRVTGNPNGVSGPPWHCRPCLCPIFQLASQL